MSRSRKNSALFVSDCTTPTTSPDPSPKVEALVPTKKKTTTPSRTPPTPIRGKEKRQIAVRPVALPPKKNKLSLEAFEEAVGGRTALADTLALAALDKKQEHFLRMLTDPRRAKDSLALIVHDAGLPSMQVLELFRNAAFAKAHAIAVGQISEAVPAIVQDIVGKAVDSEVTCPDCLGEQIEGSPCLRCRDRGTIIRTSDIDRQKLVMEISGLHKKQGGVQVNQNVQVNNLNPGQMFSKYVKESDSAAYDVEVKEVKSE